MTAGIKTLSILDPRRCWKEWMRLGSLTRVRDLFHGEGLRHPRTMKAPTISAIEKAAYRWALTNLDEAKEDLGFAWQAEGLMLTEEMWKQFLYDKAHLAYFVQPKKIQKFLEEMQVV